MSTEKVNVDDLIARFPDKLYKLVDSNPLGDMKRYSIHIRIQHALTFITFFFLAITGLPVHFSDAFWAQPLNEAFGGIENTRIIHRINAAMMTFSMIYHVITIVLGVAKQIKEGTFDIKRTQIPIPKDAFDFIHDMKFFLGLEKNRPQMAKFMYKQKIHYLAAGFGNTVMVVTGSCFLFPDIVAKILPIDQYYIQGFARLAHPHEAVLALLVIAFWHWYNVHLEPGRFPMQWTFLTGKIAREHQIEEHFLEYKRELETNPEEREYIQSVLKKHGKVSSVRTSADSKETE